MKKATLLAGVLALSLIAFAGCNNNNDAPATTTEATTVAETTVAEATTAEATDAETAETPETETPATNMAGRDITLMTWWEYFPLVEPDPATDADYMLSRMFWDNLQRVQEEFNITVEGRVLAFEELLPNLTANVLAGAAPADLMLIGGPEILSAINGDLILNAGQFTTPGADLTGNMDFVRATAVLDGDIWAFDRQEPWPHGHGIGVNLGIINAMGLDNPVDLYNSGQWTWEAMREIMVAATVDTTGDGVIDQFGLSGQPADIINGLLASNDGMLVDGATMTYGLSHPNSMEALEFAYDIFNTLNVWFYDQEGYDDMGDWRRNFFAFQENRSALFVGATWAFAPYEGGVPFDFAFVPFPVGPNGSGNYVRMAGFTQGVVMPVTTQDPQLVYQIFEEIMRWPGDEPELAAEGILSYARGIFLTEDDVQRMLSIGARARIDVGMSIHGYYWMLGDLARIFRNREMTVAQAVETFSGERQAMIDELFN